MEYFFAFGMILLAAVLALFGAACKQEQGKVVYAFLCTVLVFIAIAITPRPAKAADFYGVVGVGTGTLEQVKQDKWWYQEKFDHRWEEGTNVWKVGAGWNVSPYLALEVDYRDLGRFNSVARWVEQEDLYDPHLNDCPSGCPPTQTAYGTGTVKGVVLSTLLKYPLDPVTPYARLGVMHFEQSYNVYYTPSGEGAYGTTLRHWNESRSGFAPVYGLGVQYKGVWAEFTQYHSVASKNSAFQNASTFMVGVNVSF